MKNTFKVKAIQRIAGIIAIVAVIGFSFAACGGDDDSGGGSGGGSSFSGGHYVMVSDNRWYIDFTHPNNTSKYEGHYISNGSYQVTKGTYTVSGNTITLSGSYLSDKTWFIVDANTIKNFNGTALFKKE